MSGLSRALGRVSSQTLCAAVLGICLTVGPNLPHAQSREDAAISEAVTDRITVAWGDQPSGVIVMVNEGVVQIRGQAPSAAAADQAVQIARSTAGVRDVVSYLNVREANENGAVASTRQQEQPQQQASAEQQ